MQVGDRAIHMCGLLFFGFRLRFPCVGSVSMPAVVETFKCLRENGLRTLAQRTVRDRISDVRKIVPEAYLLWKQEPILAALANDVLSQ